MGDLVIWTIIILIVMVGFPIAFVAINRKNPPSTYPLSPKAERRRFLLVLLLGEGFFALMGYPVIVDIFIGERNFTDMSNNPNVPAWVLPIAYIWGGILIVVLIVIFVIDMYQSYKAFKLRRAEQRLAKDGAQSINPPTHK